MNPPCQTKEREQSSRDSNLQRAVFQSHESKICKGYIGSNSSNSLNNSSIFSRGNSSMSNKIYEDDEDTILHSNRISSSSSIFSRGDSSIPNKYDDDYVNDDDRKKEEKINDVGNHGKKHYDTWDVFRDKYCWGYGYNGTPSSKSKSKSEKYGNEAEDASLPFKILGTSAEDKECHPHVLSPPLMESLQSFFTPEEVGKKNNFFLKYSLLRDGPSLLELLKRVQGCPRTVLAMQTLEGNVFGTYTTEAWTPTWGYYGKSDAFVWRMRKPRSTPCESLLQQAKMESELEVFPCTGKNNLIQLCRRDKIAIGGGGDNCTDFVDNLTNTNTLEHFKEEEELYTKKHSCDNHKIKSSKDEESKKNLQNYGSNDQDSNQYHHYGFAISLGSNLTYGSTSTSETFGNPCLKDTHTKGGSRIQISNLEVWSITPHSTIQQAEKDEEYYRSITPTNNNESLSLFNIFTGRP